MNIPRHVAFIPDGNGRWAHYHHCPVEVGHRQGIATLEKILDHCYQLGVNIVTVYAFSSENWQRSTHEKDVLFELIELFLTSRLKRLYEQGVKVKVIGAQHKFPEQVKQCILTAQNLTRQQTKGLLQLALSYGGRAEIIAAAKQFAHDALAKKRSIASLDEKTFRTYLHTADTPDPDLIIRTSGEYRLSNFLLYQLAYSELYFTPTLWPDFTEDDLDHAFLTYNQRHRRFGRRAATMHAPLPQTSPLEK